MNSELHEALDELKNSIHCQKNYRCIKEPVTNLFQAKYHALADMMECLDKCSENCEFSEKSNHLTMCNCPLRKFIAINFDEMCSYGLLLNKSTSDQKEF